jgi:hypothetical protein
MSTPSVKPFNPFDLSPYAPKKVREHAAGLAAESDTESMAQLPHESAAELPAPDDRLGDGAQARAAAAPAIAEAQAAEAAAQPATHDPDMQRLETSLRWLQREGAGARLPRAVQLPPIAGLRSVGDGSRSRGEQFINGVRVPHSLAPERLRPPPEMRERRDHLRGPLRILVASVIAAPIAYYFSVGSFTLPSQPQPAREATGEVKLASIASRVVTSKQFPLPKEEVRPSEAEDYNSMLAARNRAVPPPPAPADNAASVAVKIPAEAVPEPAPTQAKPVNLAERELDPEDIKLLLQKGEQYVAAGDVVTARQVFRRAAEAGNATAALAMGATFDPTVLAQLGTVGISGDTDKAREWYERAKSFGSPDAGRRLEALAAR